MVPESIDTFNREKSPLAAGERGKFRLLNVFGSVNSKPNAPTLLWNRIKGCGLLGFSELLNLPWTLDIKQVTAVHPTKSERFEPFIEAFHRNIERGKITRVCTKLQKLSSREEHEKLSLENNVSLNLSQEMFRLLLLLVLLDKNLPININKEYNAHSPQ
ncbi:hypothetical protein J6590_020820 [Homalodisca vitripennis]|nr:hypothetical protein J6590_020820 [Homalodisca vitripennis]